MSVVLRRNEICEMQISQVKMCKDLHFDRACGTFLPNSQHLRRLFAKALAVCASTACCTKINAQGIRTDRDVRGSTQKCDVLNRAICAIQNSSTYSKTQLSNRSSIVKRQKPLYGFLSVPNRKILLHNDLDRYIADTLQNFRNISAGAWKPLFCFLHPIRSPVDKNAPSL